MWSAQCTNGRNIPPIKKENECPAKRSKGNPAVIVGLLVFAGFITIFNEVEMNIALSTVSEMYDVPVATAQWLTTGYMLIAGTLMPLAAFVMSRLGSRNTVVMSLLALLVGVLISLFSTTFEMLLAGRLLQAVCAAFFMPVMFATIMAIAPKEKIGMYNGLAMLVLMAAPAISPIISGLILSTMGFHWLFTLMLPFLAIALAGMFLFMTDVLEHRESKVDVISVVLSCLGFGGVVFGIGQAATYGFVHPLAIVPIVVGAIALTTNSLSSLEKSELPDGSSMNNTLNQIFGSIGTALYTLIVYQVFATTESDLASTASSSAATSLTMGSMAAMILSAILILLALAAFFAMRKPVSKDVVPEEASRTDARCAL